MIRAKFSSKACSRCGQPIEVGEYIDTWCKNWVHVRCTKSKPRKQSPFEDALALARAGKITREQVQGVFRSMVRDVHPDSGGDTGSAAERMTALIAQRDQLLQAVKEAS